MKIPKVLLGAILVGIAVQTTTSCNKKEQDKIKPQSEQSKENSQPANNQPWECQACGMG